MLFLLTFVLFLALNLSAQAATTYHMSPGGTGDCSAAAHCGSFATARPLLTAGDTLFVHGGTYNNSLVVNSSNPLPGGTAWSNPVTITASPGETVTVNGRFDLNAYGGNGMGYIIIKGITWQGQGNFIGGPGIHHIRIEECEIQNTPDTGIEVYDTLGFHEFLRNKIHHNGVNRLDHGMYGLWKFGLIDGNEFYENAGYGLQFYVSGNCNDPIPEAPRNCGRNTIIRNNKLYNNHGDGAAIISRGDNIQVYNNLIYNNDISGDAMSVAYGDVNNMQVFNNTFYGNPHTALRMSNDFGGVVTNTQVKNNIFSNNGGTPIVVVDATGTVFATNLCNSNTTGCTHITSNPQFVNAPLDFHLQASSPFLNQGADLRSVVTTDAANTARPQGSGFEMGAYEYAEGSGTTPPTGNPIHVNTATGLDPPARNCIEAESPSTPFLTITQALGCMLTAGKKIWVHAGTYPEALSTSQTPIVGGSGPSALTTIQAWENAGVPEVVTIQLPVGKAAVLTVDNADSYLLFKNLVFDGALRTNSDAVFVFGANHITFENCEFKNATLANVFVYQASDVTFLGGSSHHSQAGEGLLAQGTSPNLTVTRFQSHTNGGAGVSLFVGDGVGVNVSLKRLSVHDNAGNGIDISTSTGAVIHNSLLYDNSGIGGRIRTGASGLQWVNNTVYSNTGNGVQCDSGAGSPTPVAIANTILFADGAGLANNCGAVETTNFTANPLFVAPPGNLQLADGSAGINTGTTLPGVTEDYAGNPRPDTPGGQFDRGAYERGQTAPPIPPSPDVTVRPRNLQQAGMLF